MESFGTVLITPRAVADLSQRVRNKRGHSSPFFKHEASLLLCGCSLLFVCACTSVCVVCNLCVHLCEYVSQFVPVYIKDLSVQ